MDKETLEEAAERHESDRDSFEAGANWQAEKMYSEEEVFSIIEATLIEYSDFARDLEGWFKQFKKK